MLVVIKLPYLKSSILCSKLSKGMGHNYYGEPAWPNDILYIFPIVIFGIRSYILGLATHEPLKISEDGNPFATPNEILPEWYLFPTFNLLRILSNKFMGILSMFYLPGVLLIIPFGENLNRYQNPFRRPIMLSIFLIIFIYSIWLSIGPLQAIIKGWAHIGVCFLFTSKYSFQWRSHSKRKEYWRSDDVRRAKPCCVLAGAKHLLAGANANISH